MVSREEKYRTLSDALHYIAKHNGGSPVPAKVLNGVTVQPVGRNQVWRIEDGRGDLFFAKRWRDPVAFERELLGYQLAQSLAQSNPLFMAAEVLGADRDSGIIATASMEGRSASSWFKQALRIDRNPFRRLDVIEDAKRSIRSITTWLRAFHSLAVDTQDALYDHGPEEIIVRINRKLKQLAGDVSMSSLFGMDADLSVPHLAVETGLVFGDATLGNFFYDGERVGAVDFEDVGVGPIQRDFSILFDSLQGAMDSPFYYSDQTVRDLIPGPSNLRLKEIIELEIHVFRYEHLQQRRNLANVLRSRREKSMIRNLVGSIRSHH